MVGVPGRSKGCNTCRKRKIACSLERPHCFQCTRSGRVCLGYQKERVFVTSIASSESSSGTWRPDAYSKPIGNNAPTSSNERRPLAITTSSSAIIGHQSLEKAAFRHQILSAFFSVLSRDRTTKGPGVISLISALPGISVPTKALELSAFAICTSRLACAGNKRDIRLVQTSRKIYGQALQAMQVALSDPVMMRNDQTLGACVFLALYEVYECPSNNRTGYMTHFDGCARLVELRGPEAHKQGLSHDFFRAFRTMGAFESLANKQTFLKNHDWRIENLADGPSSPFDRLITLLFDSPIFMRHAAAALAQPSPHQQLQGILELTKSAWKVEREFEKLYEDLKATVNGPLYWPVFSKPSTGTESHTNSQHFLFPIEFEFVNLHIASTLLIYWASLSVLWSGMCQLHALIDKLSLQVKSQVELQPNSFENVEICDSTTLPPLAHRRNFIDIVRCVCQSVEYCLRDEIGLPLLLSPLTMVYMVICELPQYQAEAEWIFQTLERLKRQYSIAMVAHLPLKFNLKPTIEPTAKKVIEDG